MDSKTKQVRKFEGKVVSASMNKTISVRVDTMKMQEKYKKYYRVSKKYLVHDEKSQAKPGDNVRFVECRPISKNKRWRLVEVVK
ncbi:MAG: 30S ribosomal protein S17 [Patescibacteria group bacterium]